MNNMKTHEVINLWDSNKIVYQGTYEECYNYLKSNNIYQMNYTKLQIKEIT